MSFHLGRITIEMITIYKGTNNFCQVRIITMLSRYYVRIRTFNHRKIQKMILFFIAKPALNSRIILGLGLAGFLAIAPR